MGNSTATTIAAVLSLLFVHSSARGQAPGNDPFPPRQPPQPAIASTALSGQLELARLVDLAAQRLAVNIEYDAAALKGTVTLRLEGPVSDSELWLLVNRVLATRGFTTVRSGVGFVADADVGEHEPQRGASQRGTYSVVRLAEAASVAMAESTRPINDPPDEGLPAGEGANRAAAPAVRDDPVPGFRIVVVRVRNRAAKDLIEPLTRVMSKGGGGGGGPGGGGGTIVTLGDGGLLMISDLSPRIDQALELLALLDEPESRTVVQSVPVRNMTGEQMATLATTVAGKRDAVSGGAAAGGASGGTSSAGGGKVGEVVAAPDGDAVLVIAPQSRLAEWTALIESLDQRERAETVAYAPASFAASEVGELIEQTIQNEGDDRWKLVEDRLTGSLIITATPTQHFAISELLARLDSVPAEARRPMRTFLLRNRPVREVISLLQDLLEAGALDAGDDARGGTSATASDRARAESTPQLSERRPPPPGRTEPGVQVGALSPTEAADPKPSGRRDGVRDDTQARSPSAAVALPAARRLSLTADEATNTLIAVGEPRLLAQVEALIPTLDVRQPQVMLEAMLVSLSDSQSLALGVELEKLELGGDTLLRLSSLFGLSSATGSGQDRSRSVGDAPGFTGVVLNPGDFSMVVRALETINDGRSLSVPKVLVSNNQQATFNSTVQQPFAATNASDTVATTSFGGTFDAGTTISARPQIADGDHLLLEYNVSLSSFVGSASTPELPPPRQQNNVSSSATIPDGYVVVVGGIEVTTEGESITQVPIVGSIPLIGELFKNRSTSVTRSRFFVFLRATVLRGQTFEHLKFISDRDLGAARIDDGWPEVEPRVIR